MRTTRSFIVRLLVDSDDPSALRGAIQSVADAQEYSFTDERSLLDLLYRMTNPITESSSNPQPSTTQSSAKES